MQEPRPLPAGSSITHLFEYENWKTLEKYIETDVANYLQKLFGMLAELRAERLSQVRMMIDDDLIGSQFALFGAWASLYVSKICIHVSLVKEAQIISRTFHPQDATGKVPLLCAPFERRDFVGLDLESRQNKRRTYARFKKHLGDLSLACGRAR